MKKVWQPLFLAFLVGATVLIIRQQRNMPFQHNKGMVFGTFYNVTYQNDSDLKEEIETELKKVDDALSMFNPTSVISRINNGADHFDHQTFPHYHVHCSECGKVADVAMPVEELVDMLSDTSGYKIMGYSLQFDGLCPECAKLKVERGA